MLRVESGQSLGGRCWVSPGGRPVAWIDKRMEGGEWGLECSVGRLSRRTLRSVFYCGEFPVAEMTDVVDDNGILVHQLRPVGEVASVEIPQEVMNELSGWTKLEDSDLLGDQIRQTCEQLGVDGSCRRAVGLLVYLLREGWIKV